MSDQNKPKTFSVGDIVTWTSQAGGKSKTKTGKIVATVPAKKCLVEISEAFTKDGFNVRASFSTERLHESYLVKIEGEKRLYWPLVKYLEKVEPFIDNGFQ